jgi:hypothetical protein
METLRELLDTPKGKAVAGLLIAVAVVAVYYSYRANVGASEAARMSSHRFMVCSETLKPFEITVKEGTRFPCKSPYTGRDTGYPAELCFWTRDGQIKDKPTPVLLNSQVGKPGPTFCPECGRLVISRNPPPVPGRPPVTQDEYNRHGRSEE